MILFNFSFLISEKSTSTSLCNNSRPVDKSSNGRFPQANSYKEIPKEKISPFLSGLRSSRFELNFSGGAYASVILVPWFLLLILTLWLRRVLVLLLIPKSLKTYMGLSPRVSTRILAGLMSWCTILFWCK